MDGDRGGMCWLLRITVLGIFSLTSANEESGDVRFANSWAVHLDNADPDSVEKIATRHGFVNLGQIGSLPGYYHFVKRSTEMRRRRSLDEHADRLQDEPQVTWVEQQRILERSKRHVIPDENIARSLRRIRRDKAVTVQDPLYKNQWYLQNVGQSSGPAGIDINVLPVWAQGYSGKGVVVSVLDDGVDYTHPDLKRNYDPDASFDFIDFDADPKPRDNNSQNSHGTKCAGEVAAEANNGVCGVGVSFNARIGGIRMLDGKLTDTIEGSALSYRSDYIDIYSSCWGPKDDGKRFGKPGILASKALQIGAERGRGGKGNIFVWATGNGGMTNDDCNCDGYTTSIYTVSIGAISDHGLSTYYSETCASTLAVTFSGGSHREAEENNIITTGLHHTCSKTFKGTSSAAPLAAGMIALVLEANPSLTWRDVQHLIVETSQLTSPMDEGWKRNGAGIPYNHKFGFGRLDAMRMVERAVRWTNVGKHRTCQGARHNVRRYIPSSGSLILNANTSACSGSSSEIRKLEHVQVVVTLKHRNRGNLVITLISPSGTRSELLTTRRNDQSKAGLKDWVFMTVHCWGEDPKGAWTLVITDNNKNTREHHVTKLKNGDFEDVAEIFMDDTEKHKGGPPRSDHPGNRTITGHKNTAAPLGMDFPSDYILKSMEDSVGELVSGDKFANVEKARKARLKKQYQMHHKLVSKILKKHKYLLKHAKKSTGRHQKSVYQRKSDAKNRNISVNQIKTANKHETFGRQRHGLRQSKKHHRNKHYRHHDRNHHHRHHHHHHKHHHKAANHHKLSTQKQRKNSDLKMEDDVMGNDVGLAAALAMESMKENENDDSSGDADSQSNVANNDGLALPTNTSLEDRIALQALTSPSLARMLGIKPADATKMLLKTNDNDSYTSELNIHMNIKKAHSPLGKLGNTENSNITVSGASSETTNENNRGSTTAYKTMKLSIQNNRTHNGDDVSTVLAGSAPEGTRKGSEEMVYGPYGWYPHGKASNKKLDSSRGLGTDRTTGYTDGSQRQVDDGNGEESTVIDNNSTSNVTSWHDEKDYDSNKKEENNNDLSKGQNSSIQRERTYDRGVETDNTGTRQPGVVTLLPINATEALEQWNSRSNQSHADGRNKTEPRMGRLKEVEQNAMEQMIRNGQGPNDVDDPEESIDEDDEEENGEDTKHAEEDGSRIQEPSEEPSPRPVSETEATNGSPEDYSDEPDMENTDKPEVMMRDPVTPDNENTSVTRDQGIAMQEEIPGFFVPPFSIPPMTEVTQRQDNSEEYPEEPGNIFSTVMSLPGNMLKETVTQEMGNNEGVTSQQVTQPETMTPDIASPLPLPGNLIARVTVNMGGVSFGPSQDFKETGNSFTQTSENNQISRSDGETADNSPQDYESVTNGSVTQLPSTHVIITPDQIELTGNNTATDMNTPGQGTNEDISSEQVRNHEVLNSTNVIQRVQEILPTRPPSPVPSPTNSSNRKLQAISGDNTVSDQNGFRRPLNIPSNVSVFLNFSRIMSNITQGIADSLASEVSGPPFTLFNSTNKPPDLNKQNDSPSLTDGVDNPTTISIGVPPQQSFQDASTVPGYHIGSEESGSGSEESTRSETLIEKDKRVTQVSSAGNSMAQPEEIGSGESGSEVHTDSGWKTLDCDDEKNAKTCKKWKAILTQMNDDMLDIKGDRDLVKNINGNDGTSIDDGSGNEVSDDPDVTINDDTEQSGDYDTSSDGIDKDNVDANINDGTDIDDDGNKNVTRGKDLPTNDGSGVVGHIGGSPDRAEPSQITLAANSVGSAVSGMNDLTLHEPAEVSGGEGPNGPVTSGDIDGVQINTSSTVKSTGSALNTSADHSAIVTKENESKSNFDRAKEKNDGPSRGAVKPVLGTIMIASKTRHLVSKGKTKASNKRPVMSGERPTASGFKPKVNNDKPRTKEEKRVAIQEKGVASGETQVASGSSDFGPVMTFTDDDDSPSEQQEEQQKSSDTRKLIDSDSDKSKLHPFAGDADISRTFGAPPEISEMFGSHHQPRIQDSRFTFGNNLNKGRQDSDELAKLERDNYRLVDNDDRSTRQNLELTSLDDERLEPNNDRFYTEKYRGDIENEDGTIHDRFGSDEDSDSRENLKALQVALKDEIDKIARTTEQDGQSDVILRRVQQDVKTGDVQDLEKLELEIRKKIRGFGTERSGQDKDNGMIDDPDEGHLDIRKRSLDEETGKQTGKQQAYIGRKKSKFGDRNSGLLKSWSLVLYGTG